MLSFLRNGSLNAEELTKFDSDDLNREFQSYGLHPNFSPPQHIATKSKHVRFEGVLQKKQERVHEEIRQPKEELADEKRGDDSNEKREVKYQLGYPQLKKWNVGSPSQRWTEVDNQMAKCFKEWSVDEEKQKILSGLATTFGKLVENVNSWVICLHFCLLPNSLIA